jgi:hypothetical protein
MWFLGFLGISGFQAAAFYICFAFRAPIAPEWMDEVHEGRVEPKAETEVVYLHQATTKPANTEQERKAA